MRPRMLLMAAMVVAAAGCGGGASLQMVDGAPRPVDTRHSSRAKEHIRLAGEATGESAEALFGQALTAALEGIAMQPANPQHYFLAGVANAGLGQLTAADSMWRRAQEMWPEYGREIARHREQSWVEAFGRGAAAHQAGRLEDAVAEWRSANLIFPGRPEAYFNLGALDAQRGDYEGALRMYRQAIAAVEVPAAREMTEEEIEDRRRARRAAYVALGQLLMFVDRYAEAEAVYRTLLDEDGDEVEARTHLAVALVRQGRAAEASELYDQLLSAPELGFRDLMHVGLGLFHGGEFGRAAEAFRRATLVNPHSRDGLHNLVLALYAEERWPALIGPAERLLEMDPLNESAALILAHALRETGRHQRALARLQSIEAQPVHLDNLQLRRVGERLKLSGQAVPNAADPGSLVRLRFTFLGPDGVVLESQLVSVPAPGPGESASFELPLSTDVEPAGYLYRVAP